MSIDEIRNQKALALLEFQEAHETVARLVEERNNLALKFHDIAHLLEQENPNTTTLLPRYQTVTVDAALSAVETLGAARQQLAEASAKKKQFGL
jgi:hypothetical protein